MHVPPALLLFPQRKYILFPSVSTDIALPWNILRRRIFSQPKNYKYSDYPMRFDHNPQYLQDI